MDGLSVAANVLAVVDLSAKVAALCFQYSKAVVNARGDIARLQDQIQRLDTILQHARRLIESSGGKSLPASGEVVNSLREYGTELDDLLAKLEIGSGRKAMRRVGLRALKWPFNRQELEAIILRFERYQLTISVGLTIDQTSLLLNIDEGIRNIALHTKVTGNGTYSRKAHFSVPFSKDGDFVARPTIWTRLTEQYAASSDRIALVGLGGIGKSQIAIQFAYATSSPDTSVFWVNGSTRANFEESYRRLADMLALPRCHEPSIDLLALVRDMLQSADVAPWLMILDNADNADIFFAKYESQDCNQAPIASYLPKTGKGKILITSRSLTAAERLAGGHKAIIEIPTMDSSEAMELFHNKLKEEHRDDNAPELVETLGFVPLAVTQAAAYINRRAPRVSVRSYLDSFRESEKQKSSLLNANFGDLRRQEGISNSIVVTWQITFEQIRQERRSAANLLSLMSLFRPQDIPEYMLHGYGDENGNEDGQNDDLVEFEDDFDTLRGYSLVKLTATKGACDMHPLVQFCTQIWLSKSDELMRWKGLFLRLSWKHMPDLQWNSFDQKRTSQTLLPHVKSIINDKSLTKLDTMTWSRLVTRISETILILGDYFEAERIAQISLHEAELTLGGEHPCVMWALSTLCGIYCFQKHWDKAESVQIRHIKVVKVLAGEEDPATLVAEGNLGLVYLEQGRLTEAAQLLERLLDLAKRMLGEDDCYKMNITGRLALVYCEQERWVEAESLQLGVVEKEKRLLGEEHAIVRGSFSILGYTYLMTGRWDEAESMYTKVVEIGERLYGEEHTHTLNCATKLATVYLKQGRLEEAEALQTRITQTMRRMLGDEHPLALNGMSDMAITLRGVGRLDEAVETMRDTVVKRRRILGPDHPTNADSEELLVAWERELSQ